MLRVYELIFGDLEIFLVSLCWQVTEVDLNNATMGRSLIVLITITLTASVV
jgi:hypothetical protein